MEFHPVANLFPLLLPDELDALAADIHEHGLLEPIVTHEGKIVDGRNRFLACEKAGIAPRFVGWHGQGSLTQWVISINLHRRHLTPSQKAAIAAEALPLFEEEARKRQQVAAELTNTKLGRKSSKETLPVNLPEASFRGEARERAGSAVGVSASYVSLSKSVKEKAPDLFKKVKAGELNVKKAHEVAVERGDIQRNPRPSTQRQRRSSALPASASDDSIAAAPAVPADPVSPRLQEALDAFSRDLPFDLFREFPAVLYQDWEKIIARLTERMRTALEPYKLVLRARD